METRSSSITSRRESSAVASLHQFASANDLKIVLQCSICTEIPLPPIFTCTNGHNTCGKCRSGGSPKCIICKEDLTNSRNPTMELIVSSSSFWCKYINDGCGKVIKGNEYREHVLKCEFRKISCWEWETIKCNGEQIGFKEYFKHLKTVHRIEGFQMNNTVVTMSEYSNCLSSDGPWPLYYFEYEDELFFRNMKVHNSILYIWFTILGSSEQAKNYGFKVTIYMKHSNESKSEWVLPVYSIRQNQRPENSNASSIYQVSMPTEQLKLYCTPRPHPYGNQNETYKYVFDLKYELIFKN